MWRLFAAVALLLLPSLAWAEVEARCTELGHTGDVPATGICRCSETMNVDDSGTFDGGLHNFSNSSSGEQCSGGEAGTNFMLESGGFTSVEDTESGVDLPAGHSIDFIPQATYSAGLSSMALTDYVITDSTLCHRIYVKFSTGWPDTGWGPTADCDIKAGKFDASGSNPDPGQQCIWEPGGLSCTGANSPGSTFDTLVSGVNTSRSWMQNATGEEVDFENCQESWCRIDRCFDHNSRSGGDADKLTLRMRVTNVNTQGVMQYATVLSELSNSIARSGDGNSYSFGTPDWGTQACIDAVPSGYPTGEKQWVSHAMIAIITDADQGIGTIPADREDFWIGAASEIEGSATPSFAGGSLTGGSLQ